MIKNTDTNPEDLQSHNDLKNVFFSTPSQEIFDTGLKDVAICCRSDTEGPDGDVISSRLDLNSWVLGSR